MNIQPVRLYNTINTNFQSSKRRSVKPWGQDEFVSPQKQKINPKALFLAFLLSLSLTAGMSACGSAQATQGEEIYQNELEGYSENTRAAAVLRDNLFAYGDKLTVDIAQEELEKFFIANGIYDVDVEDINNPTDRARTYTLSMKMANAAFWALHDNEINYAGGTMYIDKSADLSDEYQRIIFIDEVVHESTHALQSSKDTTKQGLLGIAENLDDAQYVFWFLNAGMGDFVENMIAIDTGRNAAILSYISNKVPQTKQDEIIELQKKYQDMIFYEKPVEIDEEFIEKSIVAYSKALCAIYGAQQAGENFKTIVNHFADFALNSFLSEIPHLKDEEPVLKKMLLAEIIYMYKMEAEAYETGNLAYKKGMGLKDSEKAITDFTPAAYRMIISVLEDKMKKEFS